MVLLSDKEKKEYVKWLQSLQSFINKKLELIIEDKIYRNKFLTMKQMKIWEKAFTHETYSIDNNYEELEYMGDAILKWAFPKYLTKRLPGLQKNIYSEIYVEYQSKMMQGKLAQELELGSMVRIKGIDKSFLNIDADLFESFFGALEETADNISIGIGTTLCYNMIVNLYKDIDISLEKSGGSVKTQVLQIFNRFDLPAVIEKSPGYTINIVATNKFKNLLNNKNINLLGNATASKEKDAINKSYYNAIKSLENLDLILINKEKAAYSNNKQVEFSVSLHPDHINFLKSFNIHINNSIIGIGYGSTKKSAEFEAYTNALNSLNKYNINKKWAEETKTSLDLSDKDLEPFIHKAYQRLYKEGYISMNFFVPRKTTTKSGSVISLVGVTKNKKQDILYTLFTTNRENSYKDAKYDLIYNYAHYIDSD